MKIKCKASESIITQTDPYIMASGKTISTVDRESLSFQMVPNIQDNGLTIL